MIIVTLTASSATADAGPTAESRRAPNAPVASTFAMIAVNLGISVSLIEILSDIPQRDWTFEDYHSISGPIEQGANSSVIVTPYGGRPCSPQRAVPTVYLTKSRQVG